MFVSVAPKTQQQIPSHQLLWLHGGTDETALNLLSAIRGH